MNIKVMCSDCEFTRFQPEEWYGTECDKCGGTVDMLLGALLFCEECMEQSLVAADEIEGWTCTHPFKVQPAGEALPQPFEEVISYDV